LPHAFAESTDAESADRKLRAIELLAERFGAIDLGDHLKTGHT
jgi:hypothetical protein